MKKTIYLFVIFLLLVGCGNNSKKSTETLKIVSNDLLDLIRVGYDQVNGSSFLEICKRLNDSILNKSSFEIQVISVIDQIDSTIDWGFWYMDINRPSVYDRMLFQIDINKEECLSIQGKTAQVSEIQDLARNYIFYPDSLSANVVQEKRYFDSVGEIETSTVFAMININLMQNNGFSPNDWKFFYAVLDELIRLCEDERDKTSLKLWGKEYDSIAFNRQEVVADIIGYHIMIKFY